MKNKKEPSISPKVDSKHLQVISSKFPKSFRGADDLVVFYEFESSHQHPLNSSGVYLKSPDGALIEFWENRKFIFCTVQALLLAR